VIAVAASDLIVYISAQDFIILMKPVYSVITATSVYIVYSTPSAINDWISVLPIELVIAAQAAYGIILVIASNSIAVTCPS
jgi:hypothetical protein